MARMIRDYTLSDKMNKLSAFAERLFIRLLLRVDDFGNFKSDIKFIRRECFPLNFAIRNSDMLYWYQELVTAGLIVPYEAKQEPCFLVHNFNQRLRWRKARFPRSPFDVLTKEESSKEEKEVEDEIEEEVVVVVVDKEKPLHDENYYKKKCYDFCYKNFNIYFKKEAALLNSAIGNAEKSANEQLNLNPKNNEKIQAKFDSETALISNRLCETVIKNELTLFWAFNEAKEVPFDKRFKNLKLWLLRKK